MKALLLTGLLVFIVACGKKPSSDNSNGTPEITVEAPATNDTAPKQDLKNAIVSGDDQLLNSALKHIDSVDFILVDKQTPLTLAISLQNYSIIAKLIEVSKNLDLPNEDGDTPLIIAAKDNYPNVAELLIKKGANLNLTDGSGRTALGHATWLENRYQIRKLLIQYGADFTIDDPSGLSLEMIIEMWSGINSEFLATFELIQLIKSHEKVTTDELEKAVKNQKVSYLKYLLINYPEYYDLFNQENFLVYILRHANELSRANFLDFLLNDRRIAINNTNNGTTPLIYATKNKMASVMMLLLSKGAEIKLSDENNMNPLDYAAANIDVSLVNRFFNIVKDEYYYRLDTAGESGRRNEYRREFRDLLDKACTNVPPKWQASRRNMKRERNIIRTQLDCLGYKY